MNAIVLESNGSLVYKDVPAPEVKEDECLIKVKAAGICHSDISRAFENGAYHYPLIMGHEFSGEIVECGKGVSGFSSGQNVTVFPLLPCFECHSCREQRWVHCSNYDYYGSRRDGAFAQFITVKQWNLLLLPDGCDLTLAALTEPLAVAVHTAKSVREDKKGKLLIIGAGYIGLSVARLVEKRGRFSEIWIFDRNKFKLDIAGNFGYSTQLLDAGDTANNTFAKYFDVVIEACGATDTYRNSIQLCNNKAQLIWMGNIQGDLCLTKGEVSSILRREIEIHGVWNSDYQPKGASDWKDAVDIIRSQEWLRKLVTRFVPLSEGKIFLEELYKVKKNSLPHAYLKSCLQIY
jgi:L-iditol 2-dehydrogenase